MKSRLAAIAATLAAALAGCGGSHTNVAPPAPPAPLACVPGLSYMGCASGIALQPNLLPPRPPSRSVTHGATGCVFPDVSSFQGHPDWAAASPHICAAVAKAGESTSIVDPDFAWNVSQLRALRIPWGAYWFVRGCSDGAPFVRELAALHFQGDRDALRPVLDMEVPSAAGCAVPLAAAVHRAFGVWPVIYTAPGTWPGGSSGGLDVWEAAYTLGSRPSLPFAARVLGWQRYSPPFTFLSVAGLGTIDESLNMGYATSFAFPGPVNLEHYERYPNRLFKSVRARERSTVENWDKHGCRNPVIRAVCRVDHARLEGFAHRIWVVAHHSPAGRVLKHPRWADEHYGGRERGLLTRLTAHQLVLGWL